MYLILDSYGTLVEMDDFYGRLHRGFARLGIAASFEAVKIAAHREMRFYMKQARFAVDWPSYEKIRLQCAHEMLASLSEQQVEAPISPEAVAQVLGESIVFKPLPDAPETLAVLKERGVRLGVVSNWDYRLSHALEETRLLHFFDFVLSSAQARSEKPAREIFERGLEMARRFVPGLRARDCFYVGDHYEKDVLGARRAGMRPLWLVARERDLPSGDIHEADDDVVRLRSLKDLLKLF
jgi:FMN phosphatase YigB (HAD superfamily)